jgi:hypothetical protein
MTAVGGVLHKVGDKVLGAMSKAGGVLKKGVGKMKDGLLRVGGKIKDAGSNAANKVKGFGGTVAEKARGAGKTIADKSSGARNKFVNSKPITKIRTGVTKFKTDFTTAYKANLEKINTPVTDAGTGAAKTGGAAGAGGAVDTAAKAKERRASIVNGVAGIATAGVMLYQVKSANKQYKQGVAREDAYNAALKAESDAAAAATAQTNAEYSARTDSYTAALAADNTRNNNIYSSGYAGDSVFSSPLKNPKYTLI